MWPVSTSPDTRRASTEDKDEMESKILLHQHGKERHKHARYMYSYVETFIGQIEKHYIHINLHRFPGIGI